MLHQNSCLVALVGPIDFAAVSLPAPHLLSIDTDNLPLPKDLKAFLRDISTLPALRDCGRYGRRRCRRWLCARCGPKRQKDDATHAREVVAGAGTVLLWSASVAGTAAAPLADVWDDLDATWSAFSRRGWLSARVDGYVRYTGITVGAQGWHPHLHTVLVQNHELTRADALRLGREITSRWVGTTSRLGIVANPLGQDVQHARSGFGVATYAAWQIWGHTERPARTSAGPLEAKGLTPEGVLRAAWAGDADALDLWHELEHASHRRRLRAVGGAFRGCAESD